MRWYIQLAAILIIITKAWIGPETEPRPAVTVVMVNIHIH